MHKLRIVAEDAGITMTADLNDSETAKKLVKTLPVESHAQIWGEEVYFEHDCLLVPRPRLLHLLRAGAIQPREPPRRSGGRCEALRARPLRGQNQAGTDRGRQEDGTPPSGEEVAQTVRGPFWNQQRRSTYPPPPV